MVSELQHSMTVKQLAKSYRSRLLRPGRTSGTRDLVLRTFQIRRKIERIQSLFDTVIFIMYASTGLQFYQHYGVSDSF